MEVTSFKFQRLAAAVVRFLWLYSLFDLQLPIPLTAARQTVFDAAGGKTE